MPARFNIGDRVRSGSYEYIITDMRWETLGEPQYQVSMVATGARFSDFFSENIFEPLVESVSKSKVRNKYAAWIKRMDEQYGSGVRDVHPTD
jgi:hypothetical protein